MTTNQTIDGVRISRELAERLTECWNGTDARIELRALLDADKVNSRQMGLVQFVEAHPLLADQAQREPVAFGWWRVPAGLPLQGMFLHYDPEHAEQDIQNAIDHGFAVTRLYAEQPAPVAQK